MITIYTIAFNEELLLPRMISFYRNRLPNCKIVVYDNQSTDQTAAIARQAGCEVRCTDNKLNERELNNLKNNCWKDAATDWVVVCDIDEWIDVKWQDLYKGHWDIARTKYYTVLNKGISESIDNIQHAYCQAAISFGGVLFNACSVKDINYDFSAHKCKPQTKRGTEIIYSDRIFNGYDCKLINASPVISRYQQFVKRLSRENIKNKRSYQFLFPALKTRWLYLKLQFLSKRIGPLRALINCTPESC